MKVKDLMTTDVEVIRPHDTVLAAAEKMRARDVGVLPVIHERRTVGVVTDRDLAVRVLGRGLDPTSTPVSEVMTRDIHWCDPDEDLGRAARRMKEYSVRRLLVRDGERPLAGVLSLGDLAVENGERAGRVLASIAKGG